MGMFGTLVVLEISNFTRLEKFVLFPRRPFPIQQEWYVSQIFTAIPMLFHANSILAETGMVLTM